MDGMFVPPRRILTEEQFALKINGANLDKRDIEFLKWACGLPYYDQEVISKEIMPERAVAAAWRKFMGKPCHS